MAKITNKINAFRSYNLKNFNIFIALLILQILNSNTAISEEVSICRPNNMVSALMYIAEAKGFISAKGINAKFETTTNAKLCQDMLLANQADFMTGAEGPFTYLAASNPPIKILAMLGEDPETSIFARKDRGISKFEDLKGKTIAYLPGTVSYFFLARVLKKYGIERQSVKLATMQPPTMPAALVGGSVDAYSVWEPWGSQAVLRMPENIINLADTNLYQFESLFTGTSNAISQKPQIAIAIIKSLIEAEHFIEEHNQEAFMILQKAIIFDEQAFKRLWRQYKFKVKIERAPIKLMEDNFNFLKQDDQNFKDLATPDFKSFVDTNFLKNIAPERVQF